MRVVSDFESVVGNNAFIGIIICCLVMNPGILTAWFCRSCVCMLWIFALCSSVRYVCPGVYVGRLDSFRCRVRVF